MHRQSRPTFDPGDAVLDCHLHLLERAHLNLAHALARDAFTTLCSGSSANRCGEQTCRRSFCPAESECCGSPYDTSFQIRVLSCSGGRAGYGRNLKTAKVLSLKAPAKLLALAEG